MTAFSLSKPLSISFKFPKIGGFIDEAGRAFPRNPAVLAKILATAAVFHVVQIAVFGLMLRGMNVIVPWGYLFAALPIANIVSTLPLSWMGVGVRDGLYVMLFSPLYMTSTLAVLFATLWLLAMMGASVVGGVFAVLSGDLSMIKSRAQPALSHDAASPGA